MPTPKSPKSQPLPPEKQPRPGRLPASDDTTREIGKRALDDVRNPREDTDQAGSEMQRHKAPATSPIRRSDKTDGSDDR